MPNIPVDSPFGFLGVFLFIVGLALTLAGIGIVSLEKIIIQKGTRTAIAGVVLLFLGLFLVYQEASDPEANETDIGNVDSGAVEEIRKIIELEVASAIQKDIETLQNLYAVDAVVINRNGTGNDLSDDIVMIGWPNIKSQHYEKFFTVDYQTMYVVDLSVNLINQTRATANHKGVVVDGVYSSDRGIFILEIIDGDWKITQMEYGFE